VAFSKINSKNKEIKWQLKKTISMRGGVHLNGICYMPDEEVFLIGGWNNQILSIYDAQSDNYFEEIMEIQILDVNHIANMKYVDELKFLIIGGFKSNLSVYR
jgi:hypothetical protein